MLFRSTSPTEHLRDLRSEFLLKLVLAERSGIDTSALLLAQHRLVEVQVERLDAVVGTARRPDAVALWRSESAHAALRFLRRLRPQ